jgi:hypothetical protein
MSAAVASSWVDDTPQRSSRPIALIERGDLWIGVLDLNDGEREHQRMGREFFAEDVHVRAVQLRLELARLRVSVDPIHDSLHDADVSEQWPLAATPGFLDPTIISVHDLKTAGLGKLVLDPPGLLLSRLVEVIAAAESRDVVKNIQTLDAVANVPAPMTKTAAAKI